MPTTTTGIATSFIDFTRASNATVTDSDGKVKWAPHNLLLASESFDAASWAKTSVTPTANSIAAPNGTTTADTLAASGANGTTLQTFTAEAISYTFGVWLKRKTGTGNIQIAADSGTYTTVTITSDWALYTVTQTPTAGSKTAGIRIVTSADEVYAWGAALYRSDLAMQPNTSAYPLYNPTTPKNLLGYTEDYSGTGWARSNVTVSGPVVAPNGLSTADTITSASSVSTFVGIYNAINFGVGSTISIYAKAGTSNIAWVSSDTAQSYAVFNLATETVIASANGTPSITPVGDGWYRIAVSNVTVAGTYFIAGGKDSYTSGGPWGNGTWTSGNTVYLWGAQLSDSASLDSYVPVYGAAVTSAAYYGPRRDFDGATLACKGLLVEEQRANLIRYSRTLETTGSYWSNLTSGTANTLTIDNAPGPDGLSTSASMITYNTAVTGAGTYSVWRHTLATTANGTYTFSVWLKAGTTSSVYLRFSDGGGNRANTLCTLTSSWQRFTVTGATVASITTIGCDIGADGNVGGQTLTAGTVYAYGAQLELGSFATSYVPNGSAVAGATRTADVASVSTQAFPYGASEGTLVANCSFNTGVDIGSYLVQLGGLAGGTSYGSSNSIFRGLNQALVAGQRLMGLTYDDANNPTGYVITAADVNVSPSKVAYGFAANNFGVSVNGATVITDTSGAVPTSATVLTLGSIRAGQGNFLNGHIRQITYLPRRVSNAELVTRST